MIYISQGSPNSIGIELCIKSLCLLPEHFCKNITVVINKLEIETAAKYLGIEVEVKDESIHIGSREYFLIEPTYTEHSSVLNSLLTVLNLIKPTDVLITLPASKDCFKFNGHHHSGYTSFLRHFFNNDNIAMVFKANPYDLLLLSDHIPLNQVTPKNVLDSFSKLDTVLKQNKRFFNEYKEVTIFGINPHAGEQGILGKDEVEFKDKVELIRKSFPTTKFIGPIAADSYFFSSIPKNTLLVSSYHDQTLPVFKNLNCFNAAQASFGLNFLRLSVVHGTGNNIYNKNIALTDSLDYAIKLAMDYINGIHSNR